MQFNSEHCLGRLEACGKLMTLTAGTVAGAHHIFMYIHFINQACSPGFEVMPRVLISPPSTGLLKFALWTVGFSNRIGIAGVTLARTGGVPAFLAQKNPKQWDWSYQELADHRALGGPTTAPGSSTLSLPICSPFFEAGARSRSHTLERWLPQHLVLSQQRGFYAAGGVWINFTITSTCRLLTRSRSEGLLPAHLSPGQPPQALLVVGFREAGDFAGSLDVYGAPGTAQLAA